MRVERVHVQAVAEHGEAAVDAAAADVHPLGEVAPVAPDLPAGARVDRPGGVVRPGDVDHAVEHDRRRLELAELRGLERPLRRQLADVGRRDLRERTVALAAVVAAVVEPGAGIGEPLLELRRRDVLANDAGARAATQRRSRGHGLTRSSHLLPTHAWTETTLPLRGGASPACPPSAEPRRHGVCRSVSQVAHDIGQVGVAQPLGPVGRHQRPLRFGRRPRPAAWGTTAAPRRRSSAAPRRCPRSCARRESSCRRAWSR